MCPAHASFSSHCAVAYPQQPAALPQCVAGLLAAWGATLQCDACTPPTGAPRACQRSGHCPPGTRVLPRSGEFEDPVICVPAWAISSMPAFWPLLARDTRARTFARARWPKSMCPAHASFGSHCAVAYPQQPAALPRCVAGLLAAWGATLQCDACTPPIGAPRACQHSGHCPLGTRVLPRSGEFADPLICISAQSRLFSGMPVFWPLPARDASSPAFGRIRRPSDPRSGAGYFEHAIALATAR